VPASRGFALLKTTALETPAARGGGVWPFIRRHGRTIPSESGRFESVIAGKEKVCWTQERTRSAPGVELSWTIRSIYCLLGGRWSGGIRLQDSPRCSLATPSRYGSKSSLSRNGSHSVSALCGCCRTINPRLLSLRGKLRKGVYQQ